MSPTIARAPYHRLFRHFLVRRDLPRHILHRKETLRNNWSDATGHLRHTNAVFTSLFQFKCEVPFAADRETPSPKLIRNPPSLFRSLVSKPASVPAASLRRLSSGEILCNTQ